MGVNSYFHNSIDTAFYGKIRLQPLIFCDDLNRFADSVRKTRTGLIKIDFVMKQKLLNFHPDKCCYLVYGSYKYKKEVEQKVEKDPLMLCDIPLKKVKSQKYWEYILQEDGLRASVEATVNAILEDTLKTCNFSRMHGYYPCKIFIFWGKFLLSTYGVLPKIVFLSHFTVF